MSDKENIFIYPTGLGDLKSVEEYRNIYLPTLLDPKNIDPRFHKCFSMIEPYQATIKSWLDYGCGGGVFVHHLAKKFQKMRVNGWDGDYASIEIAKECYALKNTSFELRDYTAHRQLPKESYDGISFLEVIEHVNNPGEILNNFKNALKPSGYLLISTPNFLGWSALNLEFRRILNEKIGRRDRKGYVQLMEDRLYNPATEQGHISLYSAPTLTMLLKSLGFKVLDFQFVASTKKALHRLFPDTIIVLAQKEK